MVAGGADQAEGASLGGVHDVGDGLDRRAGGEPRGQERAGEEPGVGVEHAAPLGLELHDPGEVFGGMDSRQLGDVGLAHREARAGIVIAGALELAEDRLQPLGALGVGGGVRCSSIRRSVNSATAIGLLPSSRVRVASIGGVLRLNGSYQNRAGST